MLRPNIGASLAGLCSLLSTTGCIETWKMACADGSYSATFDCDGDGFPLGGEDCNDEDPTVYRGATELCDEIDNNCDGQIDEDVRSVWYPDTDGDGFGDLMGESGCEPPSDTVAYVLNNTDCDDTDPLINPDAVEVCDGINNDCQNGSIETDAVDAITYYLDVDNDGYGDLSTSQVSCEPPFGYVTNAADCNDGNADISPDATETCDHIDNDCNGDIDEGLGSSWYADVDEDGFGDPDAEVESCFDLTSSGYVVSSSDCDDTDPAVNPDAIEVCNEIDDDCDTLIDDADSGLDLSTAETWYADGDSDGFGDASVTARACEAPSGFVENDEDCNDADTLVNPSVREDCLDTIDNDCDGTINLPDTLYADTDSDGFGDPISTVESCEAVSGYVTLGTDCDDTSSLVYPGAAETCNEIDDDCDTLIDEGVTTTYYADTDADGYGDPLSTTEDCSLPTGYTSDSTDCDDTSSLVYPGAAETCNEIDDDCDTLIDEGVTTTYYADTDADGYGDPSSTSEDCSLPTGYASDNTDCDDTDADTNPGADEYCDGHDDDCDSFTDEADAVDAITSYLDSDGDGYGNPSTSVQGCSVSAGYVEVATDCDDTEMAVNPGATEICNEIDDDCDTLIDEGVTTTYYADTDADGYGDPSSTIEDCSLPTGYTSDNTDCDDTDAFISPIEFEVCDDGIDNDCDGSDDTCGLSGTESLADAQSKWTGEASGDMAGSDLLGGCDLNNDGTPDVVFAAVENDTGATNVGAVYIVTSVSSGTSGASTARTRIYGSSSGGYFGAALACGDLNDDGSDDLVVGAPGVSASAGRIYTFMGPIASGTLYDSSATMTRSGLAAGDELGASLDAGDLDHDGSDDLVVGSPGESSGGTSAGGAYIEYGPVSSGSEPIDEYAVFFSGTIGDEAGAKVLVMDADADGSDDLFIGAPGNSTSFTDAGAIYALEGPVSAFSSTISSTSAYTLYGEAADNRAGTYLMQGDVDSDGYADLLIGVPAYDDTGVSEGSLYLFYAPVNSLVSSVSMADVQIVGQSSNDRLGTDAVCADVNADGFNDLLVGADGDDSADTDAGTTYVWFGPVSSVISVASIDAELQGETGSDASGECLETLGDIDADGYDDVLVCATQEDSGGSSAGAVYLY